MTIIHTSDWHLGQTFYDYNRVVEHLHFFESLKYLVSAHHADVLLVAGDIFDTPNPSAEAQAMLYRLLGELTAANPQLQVVMTSGNHDSGARLEAPDALLAAHHVRVSVRGTVCRTSDGGIDLGRLVIPLGREGQTAAWCLAVPFLRQGDYPPATDYGQGVTRLYEALYEAVPDKSLPVVAMGHLQATGAELSDRDDYAERSLIGGVEGTSLNDLAGRIAYIALGHLHRAQRVSGNDHIRYAGAPLPMSFAERHNRQSVTLVELGTGGTYIEPLKLEPLVRLQSIAATSPDDALKQLCALPEGESANAPYLEVKVRITQPEPSLRHDVEEALRTKAVRLARLVPETPPVEAPLPSHTFAEMRKISPLGVAQDFFKRRYQEEMPEEMKRLFEKVEAEFEN